MPSACRVGKCSEWIEVASKEKLVWSRFVLQPGAVAEESRLAAQLGQLRALSMEFEAAQYSQSARDFADVLLRSDDQLFR